ncbi:MAG: MGH1-like glycoside hydrolase domain-containing protein [Pseudomonadota bacterium]
MAKRTPFVWLPSQPVDHKALFMQIHGSAQRRESEGQNRWVLARGRFVVSNGDSASTLDLTSDGRFRCWLDGQYLGGGPVRSHPAFLRSSRFELSGAAQSGERLLAVLIHLPGRDLAWYETAKGGWQPVFGDGGLYARIEGPTGSIPIEWRMIESDAWQRDAPLAGWGQNAIEVLDGNRLDPAWIEPDFNDRLWPIAKTMRAEPDAEVKARGWGPVVPFGQPIPSATKSLAEYEVAPTKVHWLRQVEPQPDLGVRERLFNEELGDLLPLPDIASEFECANPADRDLALLLSFDPYRVGRPFIEFTASGGEVIEIAVDESLPGEFGIGQSGDGLRAKDRMWVAHVARYVARPGRQRFEWFNPTGIRVMQVVIRGAQQGITVHRLGLVACHHAASFEGEFASGDPLFDTLWQRGRHTVLMCAQDGWLDCPGRESRQWLGDGAVMFDMAAYSIGPDIYPLHRQFMDQVAEGQRPDGLARMVAPGDIPASITIPDYTLHWIITAQRYLLHSGDLRSIERWMPAFERALAWIEGHASANGLIADVPEWHFIEWADLGREGWSLPFNALSAGALLALSDMATRLGRPGLAQRCSDHARLIAKTVNELHWNEVRGLYVDTVDPQSGKQAPRASQHGNALLLLFDLVLTDRIERVVAAITDHATLRLTDAPPIAMSDGPFDPETNVVRGNSFFAHYIYDAIAKAGRLDWVIDDIRRLYRPMIEAGATTLWESFAPIASLCHGFSATPVYQLSRHLLGIAPIEPGYAAFSVSNAGDIAGQASGVVPTPHGPISIAWTVVGADRMATINHPEQCRPVSLAGGECVAGTISGQTLVRFMSRT